MGEIGDIVDLHVSAVLIEIGADAAGVDAEHHLPVGRLVRIGIPRALAEDHAAGEQAVPVHHDLIRHDHDTGACPFEAGELGLLIAQDADAVVEEVGSHGVKHQGVFLCRTVALVVGN